MGKIAKALSVSIEGLIKYVNHKRSILRIKFKGGEKYEIHRDKKSKFS